MVDSPPNRDTGRIFVGREREMAELTSALDDALAGEGRLVMLAGEPGIGKTRTAQELASYAEEKGAVVLWGRRYEDEGRSDVLRLPEPTQGYAGGPLFECGLVDFQREVSDSHRPPSLRFNTRIDRHQVHHGNLPASAVLEPFVNGRLCDQPIPQVCPGLGGCRLGDDGYVSLAHLHRYLRLAL